MKTESVLQNDAWREDFRVKYGVDYHLRALAAGGYQVCSGRRGDGSESRFGEGYLLEHASKFCVRILSINGLL